MYEVEIALAVLIIGVVIGTLLRPTQAESAPLSPDELQGHPADASHHSH